MTLLLLSLLACSGDDIAQLMADMTDLERQVDDLEDDLSAMEAEDTGAPLDDTASDDTASDDTASDDTAGDDTAGDDTAGDDTAGDDTAEPTPEAGNITVDARWDATLRLWTVVVELDEDGEGYALGSYLNYDSEAVEISGRCTSFTVDRGWSPETTWTVEVEWDSGAWSCAQVLAQGQEPATGCSVIMTRPTGC